METNKNKNLTILGEQTNWDALYFYQKADVIYQLSFSFCDRFIHLYKDRTRDQVIQAARSCKQNIVEGLADGVTSTEMQLKLLNVARASLKELREDFEDYIKSRHLHFYIKGEERFERCSTIVDTTTNFATTKFSSSNGLTRKCATMHSHFAT